MIELNNSEEKIFNKINALKEKSGSHSPSVFTIKNEIKEIDIKIDACFLSNPYATDLFIDYLKKDLIKSNKLRDVLEFYPSQNSAISNFLSKKLKINSDNLLIGNGAIEIIQALLHNFVNSNIVVCIPTFSSYYEFVLPKTKVLYYQLEKKKKYQLDIKDYLNFVLKNKAKNIVLINPNNPDGGYIKKDNLEFLLKNLTHLENIIIDESFIHFASEDISNSPINYIQFFKLYRNVSLIKSMSKDFGIAGIRCGYGILNSNKVQKLLSNGYLWNSNGLSEYFFRLLINDQFYNKYEKLRKKYINEVNYFEKELSKIKQIKVYPSSANFMLIELLDGSTAENFVSKMLIKYGIYLRNCNDKIGLSGEFIRLASRSRSENKIIIDSIQKIFNYK